MQKINLAVIANSIKTEKIKKVIEGTSEIVFIGSATNIKEALKYIDSAHVILLDVDLITNNEDSILDHIVKIKSVPIIIMADCSVNRTTKTIHAMSNGAVDFIKMRQYTSKQDKEQLQKEIIEKILHASTVQISPQVKSPIKVTKNLLVTQTPNRRNVKIHRPSIILVGSSTGGPRALQQLLKDVPKDFTTPILIVQHMPSRFTKSLANRLNNVSNIRVKEATQGEIIENGTAYIAPGNFHMKVERKSNKLTILLTKEDTILGHRPSVNALLDSIVPITNVHKVVVILTGMGRDGADGIKQIINHEKDAIVIAESHETAVINGMPKAAIETNCVTEILRIEDICEALVEYTDTRGY